MAAGTPVIASDIAPVRELVTHRAHGLLVRAGRPGALARAIRELDDSPALRESLGICAVERVRANYTWEAIERRTERWYRDHLGPAPREYHDRMPLPDAESHNRAEVDHEINYLWHPRYDDKYLAALQQMRDGAPKAVSDHYDATTAALNRMRRALGRPDSTLER